MDPDDFTFNFEFLVRSPTPDSATGVGNGYVPGIDPQASGSLISLPAGDRGPGMQLRLEVTGLDNSPFIDSATSDSPIVPIYDVQGSGPPRRHSDYKPPSTMFVRNRSASVLETRQTGVSYHVAHPNDYYENISPSVSTPSSYGFPSPSVPSVPVAKALPLFLDVGPYFQQTDLNQGYDVTQFQPRYDNLASPTSPDPQLLSPVSPVSDSSHYEIHHSPTDSLRGRGASPRSSRRPSPYPTRSRSHSSTRVMGEMGRLSIDSGSNSRGSLSPNIHTQQFLAPPDVQLLEPMMSELNSFEDLRSSQSDAYGNTLEALPFSESSFTLFKEEECEFPVSPISQSISPIELQTGFRSKVGSVAIEKAASGRRKRPGEFKCDIPGCGATFTAKHNLQNHINSHMGIRNFKCNSCGHEFGTSHVLTRHLKKCRGKKNSKQRMSGSPS